MIHSEINFKVRGKNKCFSLVHNLDEFGLDIEAAMENWAARTQDFTESSFMQYVVSKDPENLICIPKRDWDKIITGNDPK